MSNNTDRTFTQGEVNSILSERLKQERTKFLREVNEREAALTRREALLTAKEDWTKRGLPADLLDSLDMSKEGVLDAAAAIIEGIRKPAGRTMSAKGGFAGTPDMDIETDDPDNALRAAMGLEKG